MSPNQIKRHPRRSPRLRIILQTGALAAVALAIVTSVQSVQLFPSSADRTLYFKLPIEGVRFHWEFLDPDAFLAGELTLRIINKDRDQTLIVFRDGRISDGWEMIGDPRPGGGFYFGFNTTDRFRTAADDSLIVTLRATQELLGQGPYSEGVLAAGTWQMSGSYSGIFGGRWNPIDYLARAGAPPIAFMECWTGVWPITVTKQEGWKGPPPDEKSSTSRKLISERGTNGRPCGSHI